MNTEMQIMEKKIVNIPEKIVKEYMKWASEDLKNCWDDNKDSFMEDLKINNENDCLKELTSRNTFIKTKEALISFMMYSLENPDEYLSDFINSGWNGFELYGSGSGRQLLSLIYKIDF